MLILLCSKCISGCSFAKTDHINLASATTQHIVWNHRTTDKRTDVWSRDFILWKINSGQWAVVWAGLWNKRVWADYKQLLRPVFSLFRGQKNFKIFFENTIATALKSYIILFLQKKILLIFWTRKSEKTGFFLGLTFEWNLSVNTWRSGTDYCWLYCD